MARSSLQLNSKWIPKVEESLATQQLTQRTIAERLEISRSSVSKFINCKPVALNTFIRLCQELNLDWNGASQPEREWNDSIESFRFKQDDFKSNPGGQISPDEIVGRDRLIEQLWDRLRQQSFIFSGERRIGKSSTLKKMTLEAPEDMLPIYRDLEGIRSPIEFVEVIWQDTETYLREAGKAQRVREFVSELIGSHFTGYRFPEITAPHWKTLLTKTIEDLVTLQSKQIVFIWDEIPHLLGNFSDEAAMETLDILRSLRQTYPDIRMVFSGSIGLHHIIKNLQKAGYSNDPTNDMYPVDGQPLAQEDAIQLTINLLRGEDVTIFNFQETATEIALAVDCIPFYIHHLVNQLKDYSGEINQEIIMNIVDESLRNPLNLWKMEHYRERIDNYYNDIQKPYALEILDILSINPPTPFQRIWQYLKSEPHTQDKETARSVLRLLMKDYYLIQEDNLSGSTYTFRYQLVQKYWRISRGL
ncbi:ATP-binding protein [Waterburya agarophytonicola K14]|uniref:ATP-binding protein n=1 Tax=Waterburya agarophytonicola KI4 TaxID=2874699 RepID=A0A964BQV0_9CYAN|nr:helix-turn-helix transcriptional regulator [Waterburya agarophytonicola]MCC0177795.1 ATP-binding protein [Waterburya agarophytonicola KI4]